MILVDNIVVQMWLDGLDSPATRRSYRMSIREAESGLGSLASCADLERLTAWRRYLVTRMEAGELAPASVSVRLAALRSFLRYARVSGTLAGLPAESVSMALRSPRSHVLKPYQIASDDEIARLMAMAGQPRDRAMLALLIGSGVRASEAAKILVGDLYMDGDGDMTLHVRAGKGRKDRMIPLPDQTADELQQYVRGLGREIGAARDARRALFPSRQGQNKAITAGRLRQIMDELVGAAGISRALSPHSLRHSYATALVRRGASLPVLQRLLGHASLVTTQRYVDHLDMSDLKSAVRVKKPF